MGGSCPIRLSHWGDIKYGGLESGELSLKLWAFIALCHGIRGIFSPLLSWSLSRISGFLLFRLTASRINSSDACLSLEGKLHYARCCSPVESSSATAPQQIMKIGPMFQHYWVSKENYPCPAAIDSFSGRYTSTDFTAVSSLWCVRTLWGRKA